MQECRLCTTKINTRQSLISKSKTALQKAILLFLKINIKNQSNFIIIGKTLNLVE